MSVDEDLKTMQKLAGKTAYSNATLIDMYAGYTLMLLLIANDDVAAAKSRSKSRLYTEDYLHSPTYQYCVEAAIFLSEVSTVSLKNAVLFYASSVFFYHHDQNKIDHWKRLTPKEINRPAVHRYVATTMAKNDLGTLLYRTNMASDELSNCIVSFLEIAPDTYDTILSGVIPAVLEKYPDKPELSLAIAEHVDACFPTETEAKRRLWMQLAMDMNVSISVSAQSMIKNYYIDNPSYCLGKQKEPVLNLIKHEAKRRGLLFENYSKELKLKGFTVSKSGDIVDLSNLYKEVIS